MSSKKKQAELREEQEWEKIDSAVKESGHFIEKYQKQLLIGIGVVVVVVCAFLAYKQLYLEPKNKEAQVALFKGEQYFRNGQDSIAVEGDGNGYVGFVTIAKDYSSTKAGKLAKLYAGLSYANLEQYDKAMEYLKGYSGDDISISPLVNGAIGDCLDNTGKSDEAVSYYIKAAKQVDNPSQSPILYKKAGLIYRSQGNHDKVIEVFTIIKNQYANSMLAGEADKYIEEATLLKAK
ncbi:tol-pal system YbgF family protein [Dysgonomonas sp. Marseille-P4361]|uniref:tetratricopeptide repeat protein n=1 Tax=Dysgonomonas sp. Marseille-P4361 TaxID=2161820 RepID=UPI000D55EB8A|nr:hypothetical protein [Dysgonomonas sp. Marseille-P4361]